MKNETSEMEKMCMLAFIFIFKSINALVIEILSLWNKVTQCEVLKGADTTLDNSINYFLMSDPSHNLQAYKLK